MGIFDKIKGIIINNDMEDDNYGDEGYLFDENNADADYGYDEEVPAAQANQNMGGGMSLNSSALELKVVRPEKYDSNTAQKIADHLLNRRTVVLNLELANKESCRRLIDFLSGVAYSIDGYIQRVANNTFVIVPNNVDVSGEQLVEQQPQQQAQPQQDVNPADLY